MKIIAVVLLIYNAGGELVGVVCDMQRPDCTFQHEPVGITLATSGDTGMLQDQPDVVIVST